MAVNGCPDDYIRYVKAGVGDEDVKLKAGRSQMNMGRLLTNDGCEHDWIGIEGRNGLVGVGGWLGQQQ